MRGFYYSVGWIPRSTREKCGPEISRLEMWQIEFACAARATAQKLSQSDQCRVVI